MDFDLPVVPFAIAIGIVAAALGHYLIACWRVTLRREICRACGQKSLRSHQGLRATKIMDGGGVRATIIYFEGESCGARLKERKRCNGKVPSDKEWDRHCVQSKSQTTPPTNT